MVVDDGTARFFLNAAGASADESCECDVGSRRLAAFLSYVDGGGTMNDKWVNHLKEQVITLNADEGWRNIMLGIELDHLAEVNEARRRGLEEGRKEATDRIARLAAALAADGRQGELARAVLDPPEMERLCEHYGISS